MSAAPAVAMPALGPSGRSAAMTESERRQKALEDYRKRLIDHRELDAKLKKSEPPHEDSRTLIRAHLHPPPLSLSLSLSAGGVEGDDEGVRQVGGGPEGPAEWSGPDSGRGSQTALRGQV